MIKKIKNFARDSSKKLLNNKLFMDSTLISVVSVFAGLLNFLFNIIVSRLLGQEQYGIIYPLISLLMIINLPGSALQFVMSKDISLMIHKKDWQPLLDYLRKFLVIIACFTAVLISVLILSIPFLKSFFHIQQSMPFYLLILLVVLSIFVIPFNSLIQSRERFHIYIINTLLSVTTKFIAGIGLVLITMNYIGVLWGLIVSQLLIFFYLGWDYFRFKEIKNVPIKSKIQNPLLENKKIALSFFYALLSIGAFQITTYLDSVLVRHYLPDSSGIYSAVNLLGKASFFIATAVSFVMLPRMAKDRDNMRQSNKKAFIFLSGVLIVFALFLAFTSKTISVFIFSNKYPGIENILPLYGFMFLPYAAISYLVNYYVISEKLLYSLSILAGAILQAIGIYLFHQDLIQVSLVVGVTGYLTLLVLAIDSLIMPNRRQSR